MKESTVQLKQGNNLIALKVPGVIFRPEGSEPEKEADREWFSREMTQVIPAARGGYLTIVVSDKTRLCDYNRYLPCITEAATLQGYPADMIRFLIAYGAHSPQTEEESLEAYGDTYRKYRFTDHNCDDYKMMVHLGTTSFGTRVIVRKEVVESDAIILFGALSHHYFAGYGGGRKLIFPGLAARESIYHNHSLFINFENRSLHPGCKSGMLEGNPVAEDLREADAFLPEKILISGIQNRSGDVAKIIIGRSYSDFIKSCTIYDSFYRSSDPGGYNMVIASAGGYPKDINLVQAHKAIDNTASFVKDGGRLVMLAECSDGTGSSSLEKMLGKSRGELYKALNSQYSGNGGTALALMEKSSRIEIFMVTSLGRGVCNSAGIIKVTIEEAEDIIKSETGSVALIENGSIIYR